MATKNTTVDGHEISGVYNITRLLPRHHEVIDLLLAGHGPAMVAQTLGISVASIHMMRRTPLFDIELERRRRESKQDQIGQLDRTAALAKAESILQNASERAAATLEGILDSDDDAVRLRAASAILDRVFTKESGGSRVVVNVTNEQITLLQIALQETKHESYAANRPNANGSKTATSELHESSRTEGCDADYDAAVSTKD